MTEPFLIGEAMTGGYGGAEAVKSDERVIEAYLGTGLKNKAEAVG